MKKKVLKELFETKIKINENGFFYLKEFVDKINKKIDEHLEKGFYDLTFDAYVSDYDSLYGIITVYGCREETDEEFAARIEEEKQKEETRFNLEKVNKEFRRKWYNELKKEFDENQ